MKDDELKLSPKMRKCAEYLMSADFDGNINKLCENMNISRSTFNRWYDGEDFKKYINILLDKYAESETVNIWKAIIESAKKGNLQALKMFLDLKNSREGDGMQSEPVIFISGEDEIED